MLIPSGEMRLCDKMAILSSVGRLRQQCANPVVSGGVRQDGEVSHGLCDLLEGLDLTLMIGRRSEGRGNCSLLVRWYPGLVPKGG